LSKLSIVNFAKRAAPMLISVGIAMIFVAAHLIIELGVFENGPLSKKGLIHLLDLKSLDLKFAGRPVDQLPEPQVVVAAIDDKSLKEFGLWPWDRSIMAKFITNATKGGAKVIALDAIFAEEDPSSAVVKGFLRDFETAGLTGESETSKNLNKRFDELQKLHTQAKEALTNLKGPQKVQARQAVEKLGRQLESARSTVKLVEKNANSYYQSMLDQVNRGSGVAKFAEALRTSPQTIMGYIAYYCKDQEAQNLDPARLSDEEAAKICSELMGMTAADIPLGFEGLEPSAVTGIFERVYQDVGGQDVELVRPVDGLNMADMQIRHMVAFLSPLPEIIKSSAAFGYFNADADPDGPFRRLRLLNKHNEKMYPALSLAAVAKFYDGDIRPMNSDLFPGTRLSGIEIGEDLFIPTDDHGRLLVNYYTTPVDYFPTISVADFVNNTVDPSAYKGKIVLFGMTALGLKQDIRVTPFDQATPGVYIHASAIQNMLDRRFLERFYGIALIEALLYLILGIILGLALPRLPMWGGLIAAFAFGIGLYIFDAFFVFPRGTWIMNILPSLQVFLTFVGTNVYGYFTEGKEKRQIRKAFQFYLTKSVVDEMLKDGTKLQLGGERRICTVLFSDIRGFTTISERLSPEELVSLLNSYLTPMTNLVFKYDGTLDKYMGDAIMAIFGAPVAYKDHATRCCYTALEMMAELHNLQAMWREKGLPEIDIGIGMNTGPMSVGNMGSEIRFDYTVMGDNVNLGSRLEGINKQYGTNIIISEFTLAAAKDDIHVRELDSVRVKGKREPVRIFELLGKGKPSEEAAKLIEVFEHGIQSYKRQEWEQAINLFNNVRGELKPNDFASTMYIKRCETMRENPPGEGWDGVYTMTTK